MRDETVSPPYLFAATTSSRLQGWASALPAARPLVVLDEFSRVEAAAGA